MNNNTRRIVLVEFSDSEHNIIILYRVWYDNILPYILTYRLGIIVCTHFVHNKRSSGVLKKKKKMSPTNIVLVYIGSSLY